MLWPQLVERQRLIRAFNLYGSGLLIAERIDEATGGRRTEVTILASCEVGGAIPVPIINGASAGALIGACHAIVKILAKSAPGSRLVGVR